MSAIIKGVICNKCGLELPPHSEAEHLDDMNPIHECPHHITTSKFMRGSYDWFEEIIDKKQKKMTEMEDEIYRLSQIENELTNEVEMWKEKYEALEWKIKQINERSRLMLEKINLSAQLHPTDR